MDKHSGNLPEGLRTSWLPIAAVPAEKHIGRTQNIQSTVCGLGN